MRFNVPTNWDNALIENISSFPVECIYGKLEEDPIGGGRPTSALPKVTKEHAEEHIKLAHENGIAFNYLLNSACLGNLEYSDEYNQKILEHLAWIEGAGADYVTVSIPYLIEVVKKRFPRLKVVASVFSHIESIQQAQFYQSLGADEIVVVQSQNRNFEYLSKISKAIKNLQVIVNNGCLLGCPYRRYHANINSHASQSQRQVKSIPVDYPVSSCWRARLKDPSEIIKSPWIRPEDLHYYEEVGIDKFKLSGRTKTTEWITNAVKAYAERRYNGNLFDILSLPHGKGSINRPKNIPLVDVEVDNSMLNDFIPFFMNHDCSSTVCSQCGYCISIAEKAVRIDPEEAKIAIERYNDSVEGLIWR